MPICCFCHKLALVVNSGLKELGIEGPPPPKLKELFLGTFPIPNSMQCIPEETDESANENEDDSQHFSDIDSHSILDPSSDNSSGNNDASPIRKNKTMAVNRNKSNHLNNLTQLVGLIFKFFKRI